MNNDDDVLKRFNRWKAQVGSARALSALTGKGVGGSTAERLVNDRYVNRPTNMLRKILMDLLEEQKAS